MTKYNEMKNNRWYKDYRCDLVDVRFDHSAAMLLKSKIIEYYDMYGQNQISIGTLIDIVNSVAIEFNSAPIVYNPSYVSFEWGWFAHEQAFKIVPIKDGGYAIKFNKNAKMHVIQD